MTEIQHILLTTDLSDESTCAIEPVGVLAEKIGARITLLYIVQRQVHVVGAVDPGGAGVPVLASEPGDVATIARDKLSKLRSRIPQRDRVTVETEIGVDIAESILSYAEEHDVDLIAMATHGRTGLRRLVIGSVAESVLRRAPIPVMLYPARRPNA